MSIQARSVAGYQVEITAGKHKFLSDEPIGVCDDTGPNPYDLLLASLASCKIITVQMYARRKSWPLEGVDVVLSTQKIHARDCEDCETRVDAYVDIIETEVTFRGDLSAEQRERLSQIIDRCPVHRTLTSETKIRSKVIS